MPYAGGKRSDLSRFADCSDNTRYTVVFLKSKTVRVEVVLKSIFVRVKGCNRSRQIVLPRRFEKSVNV
jgi:hypothetical protein